MEDEKFVIRKVPLDKFIDILVELYDRGLDFVDIHYLKVSENEDTVLLGYQQEYMNEEAPKDAFDNLKELGGGDDDTKPSDNDFNCIIL